MNKGLYIASMAVGLLLVVLFGIDLAIGMPFGRPVIVMEICFIVVGIILAYLGWALHAKRRDDGASLQARRADS